MDHRSWPWKKKTSEKTTNQKPTPAPTTTSDSVGVTLSSLVSGGDQENYKKVNYVQISMDSYAHLNGLTDQVAKLKDQVRSFEEEVKDLKEELLVSQSDIKAKEAVVLQHAKVAEEAVSGWEKADAEVLALKRHLESANLVKLTVEDQASHLGSALKECTRQIISVKEESERKFCDVVLSKTAQWDKIKFELEEKIDKLNLELLSVAAENASLSKEKFQAETELEYLRTEIQGHEKDISKLKYELNVASKELDIRNEEKDMSLKSADIANKQYIEGAKKIAELEAECQRLRCLVRKKLPGPAALAQMKLEAENVSHMSQVPQISFDNLKKCGKENELLKARLLVMEDETKKLKEALAGRKSELRASRDLCTRSLTSYPASTVSISEYGNDEEQSSFESSAANSLELMDDFLEMEKLAANDPYGAIMVSDNLITKVDPDSHPLLSKLWSKLSGMFGSQTDTEKAYNDIRCVVQEIQGSCMSKIALADLNSAISHIKRYVSSLAKATTWLQDTLLRNQLCENFEGFSAYVDKFVFNEGNLVEFVVKLSHILVKASNMNFAPQGFLCSDQDVPDSECIDKVPLMEKKVDDFIDEPCSNDCFSVSRICSDLDNTKSLLCEKKQLLLDLELKFASSQKRWSFVETQLKCVTESYKSLEVHARKLEAEVKVLQEKTETLEIELLEEKSGHKDALARCNDIVEQTQRSDNYLKSSHPTAATSDIKIQEKEIEEKLAACQKTIYFVGKQLQALQPQTDTDMCRETSDISNEAQPNCNHSKSLEGVTKIYDIISKKSYHNCNSAMTPSDLAATQSFRASISKSNLDNKLTKSTSYSSSSPSLQEKSPWSGFGRFFSSKGKNGH